MYNACMFLNSSNFPLEQNVTYVQLHDTGISNTQMLSMIPLSPCCSGLCSSESLNVFSAAVRCTVTPLYTLKILVTLSLTLKSNNSSVLMA